MESLLDSIGYLQGKNRHYWGERVLTEIELAYQLTQTVAEAQTYEALVAEALMDLAAAYTETGTITKADALRCETKLAVLGSMIKRYKILCASHAHIDMNWMWGFAETVSVTLDTFRTMLRLMDEFPDFTFSQSQASVYEIVEKHDPMMLAEIKRRVQEGRWEVTATNWVETDKNMPNGESLTRHILYTKRYLRDLLGLDPDEMLVDFLPDTFGHNINVPEILRNGHVKYMYHCRGYEGGAIYQYQAPSGSRILVYSDQEWYNADINPGFLKHKLHLAVSHNIHTTLKVYGVGDHGGGPTRRDVERLIDMASWPLAPTLAFGTFLQFFRAVEAEMTDVPVVDKELNYLFDGCYTTQSRIKAANRVTELRMTQAEMLNSYAAACFDKPYESKGYETAWRKLLFNHFHDILTGSGKIATRECALGLYNEVLAVANSRIGQATTAITRQINTTGLVAYDDAPDTNAEGAGAGFNTTDYVIPNAERGRGKNRVFHVFNTTAYDRSEPFVYTLWDWPYDLGRMAIKDANGNDVAFQVSNHQNTSGGSNWFWGHSQMSLLIDVQCPAFGYNTYVITEKPRTLSGEYQFSERRYDVIPEPTLENDLIKVTFDTVSMAVISVVDKTSGKALICAANGGANLQLINEETSRGMTSWTVGRYNSVKPALENIIIRGRHDGPLQSWIKFGGQIHNSSAEVTITLNKGQKRLNYQISVDWFEKGTPHNGVPQLAYTAALAYDCDEVACDIPYGVLRRDSVNMDIPAMSFCHAIDKNAGASLMLMTKTKYGFRCFDNRLTVDLVRSAYDPDPYPEIGIHTIEFALQVIQDESPTDLLQHTQLYSADLIGVSGYYGGMEGGKAPVSAGFITGLSGCVVSSVKMPEAETSDSKIIMRYYEVEGKNSQVRMRFAKPVKEAVFVDGNEQPMSGNIVSEDACTIVFDLAAYAMGAVKVAFAK